MRKLIKVLLAYLDRHVAVAKLREREAYLATSTDVFDLESRLADIQRTGTMQRR